MHILNIHCGWLREIGVRYIQEPNLERTQFELQVFSWLLSLHAPHNGLSIFSITLFPQVTSGGVVQDVSISCPLSTPPYALLTLYKYISERIPCSCRVHVHSSAVHHATEQMRGFFSQLHSQAKPHLVITLVWKSGNVPFSGVSFQCFKPGR